MPLIDFYDDMILKRDTMYHQYLEKKAKLVERQLVVETEKERTVIQNLMNHLKQENSKEQKCIGELINKISKRMTRNNNPSQNSNLNAS